MHITYCLFSSYGGNTPARCVCMYTYIHVSMVCSNDNTGHDTVIISRPFTVPFLQGLVGSGALAVYTVMGCPFPKTLFCDGVSQTSFVGLKCLMYKVWSKNHNGLLEDS